MIPEQDLNNRALKVLRTLKQHGYDAYIVGGAVRDLILDLHPKDFDVATNATPEQIKSVFKNCRLIGRRFRLAHIYFGREIIEVATFRGSHESAEHDSHAQTADCGRILRDNVYGTLEEDALRRDFTINSMYFDASAMEVVDYAEGFSDLKKKLIKLIGDPEQRYREDPVRMLRAIRFAVKLGFNIASATEEPIKRLSHLLSNIPPARLFDESLKLFMGGKALATYEKLCEYRLFQVMFPLTAEAVAKDDSGRAQAMLVQALKNTDIRIAQEKPVTPAFLFATFLWEPVRQLIENNTNERRSENEIYYEAAEEIAREQAQIVSIPKRFSMPMKEIWRMQPRFMSRSGKRPFRLLEHQRFRAAYDFLLLRADSGEVDKEIADWWTRFQEVDPAQRSSMLIKQPKKRKHSRGKHNKHGRNKHLPPQA
ncbi:MAG: polynucleotide adenylyltransferase PcnB [Gammaproteobacteria bacterium]|nr:MAG: polynucleotide adenylyltransferase PcnB [Gammaproteobacteria bacterium]